MPDQALCDLRVLDLTHYIAGPYCSKVLADFGADVIKVERPGSGDGARHLGPFLGDRPSPEASGLFLYLNTNKRGITLNLKDRAGANIFRELVCWANALVENFNPSVMPSLGFSYEELRRINPKLVMTSISNFGQTGPYKDFEASEAVIYALSSLMYTAGLPDREPMKMGGNVIQLHAGAAAALHTMIALEGVERCGRGQQVDISIHQTQTGSIDRVTTMLLAYQYTGHLTRRGYQQSYGGTSIHRCMDGYLNLSRSDTYVHGALDMVGMPELKEDPRFATPEAQAKQENKELFDTLLEPWLLEHTIAEAWAGAQKAKILSGPIYTPGQLTEDPHFMARGYWPDVERGKAGKLRYPGRPFILHDTPWRLKRPAPTLGQHNRDIYCGLLGYSREELTQLRQAEAI